jgi:ZIP family zinc transporter
MTDGIAIAAFWGGLAAASLVVGAVLAVRHPPAERTTGAVMGFGAGALLGGIAYEVAPESMMNDLGWGILAAFAAGAMLTTLGFVMATTLPVLE